MVPVLKSIFISSVFADAKVNFGPNTWGPTDPGSAPNQAVAIITKLISTVIGVMTVIAILYFVIQIIIAGLGMISSEGDKKKIEDARTRITQGMLGLVVVILAMSIAALLARILGLGTNIFDLSAALSKLGLSAP